MLEVGARKRLHIQLSTHAKRIDRRLETATIQKKIERATGGRTGDRPAWEGQRNLECGPSPAALFTGRDAKRGGLSLLGVQA
jgi:hypothetical protein